MMKAVKVYNKSQDADSLALQIEAQARPSVGRGDCLVEVHAAAVNPSDVKAMLGMMPHAVWPRTPGRDYAGIVVAGPTELIGKEVWGTGGDLGIRRDGSHAKHLVLPKSAVRAKPAGISLQAAGAV